MGQAYSETPFQNDDFKPISTLKKSENVSKREEKPAKNFNSCSGFFPSQQRDRSRFTYTNLPKLYIRGTDLNNFIISYLEENRDRIDSKYKNQDNKKAKAFDIISKQLLNKPVNDHAEAVQILENIAVTAKKHQPTCNVIKWLFNYFNIFGIPKSYRDFTEKFGTRIRETLVNKV